MNTEDFLRLIWPDGEHFFVVEATDKGMLHHHVTGVVAAARKIAAKNANQNSNLYHALASFKQAVYVDAKGKKRRRTQDNVDKLKCFWVDLDCKGKGTDYPDQITAAKDVLRFCAETQLPKPTFISSGYGLHAYWVLDESIDASTWTATALRFETTLDAYEVKHDTSCTTDSARILRPVGTHNRKPGMKDKEVALLGAIQPCVSLETFSSCLGAAVPMVVPAFQTADLSLNAAAEVEYAPSSLREILKECELIKDLAIRGGDVPEPLWHKSLGLAKHTIEKGSAIHIFSHKYAGYSAAETEAKAAAWEAGPTTCEVLARAASKVLPNHCKACKHSGNIKSPIQLGYSKILMIEAATVQTATGFIETSVEVSALPLSMHDKFKWENEKLWRNILDKDASKTTGKDAFSWVAFCDFLFYPSGYYKDVAAKHQMIWTLREREGVYKEFELTGGALGAGGQPLFKELGENSVTSMTGGKNNMEAYLTHWANELKKSSVGTETFMRFGWHGDRFLHGDTMYNPDGTTTKVRVGGDAADMVADIAPTGTLDEWKELIDTAYNNSGDEPFQFILGLGFGSILMPFMGVGGGVVVSAVSYGTGKGKTTAIRNAFGIYGNPNEDTHVTLSRSSTTHKGIFAVAGKLHNLPMIVDELTNIDGMEASEVVYTYSQGQPRVRLTSTGKMAAKVEGWSGVMLQSSNKSLISIISGAKPGADAEIARIIEFDCSVAKTLPKHKADVVFKGLKENYGVAAGPYLGWVVTHLDEVKEMLVKTQCMLDSRFGFSGENRFWSAGYTVGVVGLIIAKRVGLVAFDVPGSVRWCGQQVTDMAIEVSSATSTPAECFSRMLTSLAPGIIVTDTEGGRGTGGKEAYIIKEPTSRYTGRAVLDKGVAYLGSPAVHEWCSEHQVDVKSMIKAAFEAGWVMDLTPEKRYPGKGTNYAMGQVRCYLLDWNLLENSTQTTPVLANVVSLLNRGVAK